MYRSPSTQEFLSVFTTTRIAGFMPNQPTGWRERAYFASEDDNELSVVAWHDSDRTISLAAHLPKQLLMKLASDTALASFPEPQKEVRLASARGVYLKWHRN